MESLTSIANRYGTDKGTQGPSEGWQAHNYTDLYEAYLWPLRNAELNLLEIGLGVTGDRWESEIVGGRNRTGGASLKMWFDYFPQSHVFGLDINPARHLENDRVRTFVADQGNTRDLEAFMRYVGDVSFDVVIDDGSHRPDHQQISLGFFFKRLKSGALYFIEDLMDNGQGDSSKGRFSSDLVLNTRRVLRSFQESGNFATPNALLDPVFLCKHIEWVKFHAPWPTLGLSPGKLRPFRPIKRVVRYGSETLCVLRKK